MGSFLQTSIDNLQQYPSFYKQPRFDRQVASLKDKMYCYQRHQGEVLGYRHRFLAEFALQDLHKWKRMTLRARVERLNNAWKY